MKCPLIAYLTIALTGSAFAAESQLWQEYVAARETGAQATLPDFSHAGYDYSETPLPDTSDWTVFDVTDYGAIADDEGYDDDAIQQAANAAKAAGGGVVFFPPGQFRVSPNNNINEGIFITGSRIVLKGSGSGDGGTEIVKVNMKVNNGKFFFNFRSPSLSESTITRITADAPRGGYEIQVADASELSVGQIIKLHARSPAYARAYYQGLQLNTDWTQLHTSGFNIDELHTIAAIDGNTVRFREPLHLPIITEFGGESITITLRSYKTISEVGVEDIRFKGMWDSIPEAFVHHKNDIHDYAWNAMRLDNVVNAWIRNCEFKDWNQGIYIDGCAAVTVTNIAFTGKRGHASIHTRKSYGVLVKDSEDRAGHWHGPGVGFWGCGTVYLRYKMAGNQRMDSHSGSPYATLMDNVTGGHFDNNGGPHRFYPHHGRDFVAWNFTVSGGRSDYNFWRQSRNGHTFAMPVFAGLQGRSISFTEGTYAANESPGTAVQPASLFEAQLALRLDGDGDGIRDSWERDYFGDLTTTEGRASDDYDGDGLIDLHEARAGTDPTDGSSRLALTIDRIYSIEPNDKEIQLSWESTPGITYLLKSRAADSATWTTIATIVATEDTSNHLLRMERSHTLLQLEIEDSSL